MKTQSWVLFRPFTHFIIHAGPHNTFAATPLFLPQVSQRTERAVLAVSDKPITYPASPAICPNKRPPRPCSVKLVPMTRELTLQGQVQQVLNEMLSESVIPFPLNVGKITKAAGSYTIHFYDSRIRTAHVPLIRVNPLRNSGGKDEWPVEDSVTL